LRRGVPRNAEADTATDRHGLGSGGLADQPFEQSFE
jgi:hypothetical protein